LIVGKGDKSDRFTYWIERLSRGGDVLAPGSPDDPIRVIDVRDLAQFLVTLSHHRTGGVFNAIGPEKPLTLDRILKACAEASGAEVRIHYADVDFLEKNGVRGWTDMPVWLPPSGWSAGFHTRSIDAALRAGIEFRPIEDTARVTWEWWKTLPPERRTKLKNGLTHDREKELLEKWQSEHVAK